MSGASSVGASFSLGWRGIRSGLLSCVPGGSCRRCSAWCGGSIPRGVFRASVALPGAFIGSLITS